MPTLSPWEHADGICFSENTNLISFSKLKKKNFELKTTPFVIFCLNPSQTVFLADYAKQTLNLLIKVPPVTFFKF